MKQIIRLATGMGLVVGLALACSANEVPDDGETFGTAQQGLPKCTAGAVNGQPGYCDNPACLCTQGEGDCDTHAQCAGGLKCIGKAANFCFPGGNYCAPAHCGDHVKNFDETVVDCGGSCGTCCGLPPNSAQFTGGVLIVTGDPTANSLTVSNDGSGNLVVNGGAMPITGGTPTIANTTLIRITGQQGNDVLSVGIGLPPAELFGNDGNDTLNGGSGTDLLDGGANDDTLDGNAGADTASGGDGNDTIVWDPGDGSDVVEGQTGTDTLRFNGSAGAEIMDASANGARLRFTRNLGNIVMDCNGIENLTVNALGGTDTLTVNSLTGTQVTTVLADLGVSAAGDAAADNVVVNGTAGGDIVAANAVGGVVQVTGLTAQVNIANPEAANDRLTLEGLGGNDFLSGGALASSILLSVSGGAGSDTINGGNGADTLLGGEGNDSVDGNAGGDTFFGNEGEDTFVWDPGDGSDVLEGGSGTDLLQFNGSAGAEIFTLSNNGGRMLFTRNVGNIVMDGDDVEALALQALSGADSITINDMTVTDVVRASLDLGASDLATDTVTVNGSSADDVIGLSGGAGEVRYRGTLLDIDIFNADPLSDTLAVNLLGGNDLLSALALASTSVVLTVNGGIGSDIIRGSTGGDTLNGEDGDDFIYAEDGNDVIDGGNDTDTVNGGAGLDVAVNSEIVTNVP
jgi:Ca2+-binding RTX toxin-like protein